jgi:hypothetical protein
LRLAQTSLARPGAAQRSTTPSSSSPAAAVPAAEEIAAARAKTSAESIPLIAKSCMIERKHVEQLFKWGIESGPFGFILITNEPDGRARGRLNGDQNVVGII